MEDKFSKRDQELSSLGMKPNFQYESYVFKDVNVGFIEVQLMSDEKWEALIEKINPLLQSEWAFERLAYVDQAILLLAVCELERKLSDKAIVIDEAVELAKSYSDDKVENMISKVLDNVYKEKIN